MPFSCTAFSDGSTSERYPGQKGSIFLVARAQFDFKEVNTCEKMLMYCTSTVDRACDPFHCFILFLNDAVLFEGPAQPATSARKERISFSCLITCSTETFFSRVLLEQSALTLPNRFLARLRPNNDKAHSAFILHSSQSVFSSCPIPSIYLPMVSWSSTSSEHF